MSTDTLISMDSFMRDLYPREGERIKQWVMDSRRDAAWERETCPRVDVEAHDDNTGTDCRNIGPTPWTWLQHDCCYVCNEIGEATSERSDVVAWRAEKAARPPGEADRSKLSDEVQPEMSLSEHPMFRAMRRG